jgi:hypothetical protein
MAAVGAVSQASAQGIAPPRTPQGLFGGIRPDATASKRLDFNASVVEGYDSDVPTELRGTVDPNSLQSGGFTTMVNAGAGYSWRNARAQVAANAISTLRYYAQVGETRNVGNNAGLGASVRLPGRNTLLLNQSAVYSPTYLYGLFPTGTVVEPGDAGLASPDFTTRTEFRSYSYTTTATLRHDFSPRSNLTGIGEYQYTDRLNESDRWRDVASYALRGEYSQNVSPSTAFTSRVRYRSGEFGYGNDGTTTELGVDFGVNYSRALSGTRRATLRFNFGASGADYPEAVTGQVGFGRQYLAVGDVGVGYQFGRSWMARANYRRGLEYVVDLPTPVFADSVSAAVDGLLSRRVDVTASMGYSRGESLLARSNLSFDTYTASARVRYALTRTLATYGEYLYYFYSFHQSTPLETGFLSGLERSGVRVGLTLFVPAMRR